MLLIALGAFAAWRARRSTDVLTQSTPEAAAWVTPVTIFLRLQDQAIAHAIPNTLELVGRMNEHLAIDAHLLTSSGGNPKDEALARCAIEQGSTKGLRFIVCRQSMGQGNDDWAACAEESQLDKHGLDSCAAGPQSQTLGTRAGDEAARWGVTSTPAFFVDKRRVEGDGTRESLKKAICATVSPAPAVCAEAPQAKGFPIFVMTDSRCKECRAPFWFRRMQMLFPNADIAIVDVQTPAGRAQYDKIAPGLLPAVALDKRVEADPGFSRIQRELVKKDDMYLLSPGTVAPQFDPAHN
jgi:hypothetical protein